MIRNALTEAYGCITKNDPHTRSSSGGIAGLLLRMPSTLLHSLIFSVCLALLEEKQILGWCFIWVEGILANVYRLVYSTGIWFDSSSIISRWVAVISVAGVNGLWTASLAKSLKDSFSCYLKMQRGGLSNSSFS